MRRALPGIALGVAAVAPGGALACQLIGPEPHVLDEVEQEYDRTPPSALGAVEVVVQRSAAPGSSGEAPLYVTSCGDIGSIELRFQPPTVTPIDLGGQRGPSTLVGVKHPGRTP